VGKGKRAGGSQANALLPPPDSGTGEGGRRSWPTAIGGAPGSAAAGDRGKMKRGSRAIYPFPHLGQGRLV
jgi:hypothetical protein